MSEKLISNFENKSLYLDKNAWTRHQEVPRNEKLFAKVCSYKNGHVTKRL